MTTLLPRDDDYNAIPALRLRGGGAHAITAGATSARNAIPFAAGTRIIGIYATGPVHVRTGDADVTATADDHFFPEGVYYDLSVGDERRGRHSHIAVLSAGGADCTLYVSEKE